MDVEPLPCHSQVTGPRSSLAWNRRAMDMATTTGPSFGALPRSCVPHQPSPYQTCVPTQILVNRTPTKRQLPPPDKPTPAPPMDIAALVCNEAQQPNAAAPPPRLPSFTHLHPVGPSPSPAPATPLPTIQLPAISPPTPSVTPSPSSTPTRRVVCQLCKKSFSGVSSHNRHVSRTHHKKRPFSCHQCHASFGQKGSLERHIASVHRKERPFQCEYCAKSFGRSDNLRIHISTVHLKQRPHKCPQCPKSFGGKRPLKIHQQTVHEKKRPLECILCSRRFGQRSNLNAHLRQVHKQEPPPSSLPVASTPTSITNTISVTGATPLPPLGSLSFELPTSPTSSSSEELFGARRVSSMESGTVPESALNLLSRPEHSLWTPARLG